MLRHSVSVASRTGVFFLAALADDADIEIEMERLIDGEVATHFRSILPISTRELMDSLGLQPGPIVKEAIDALRRVYESGITRAPRDYCRRS